jgi:pimeloyl-ACP methyl ester carboxylesterase
MTRLAPALATLGLVAVVLGGGSAGAVAGSASPARDWCIHGNRVRFVAGDGTKLVGARYGRGATAVVLAHQSDGSLCEWQPYARRLASLGYLALPFDFRNYGESQHRRTGLQRLGGDVAAAAKKARKLGAKKVFLVGASMGGAAVVVGAANVRPLVAGVASVSGPANYGAVDALAAAKRLAVPALYLAGEGDVDFAHDAQTLYDATASGDRALQILPTAAHGVNLLGTSAEARALVESFISAH